MWKGYSRGGRQSGDLVNAREVMDLKDPCNWPFVGLRLHTLCQGLPAAEQSLAPPGWSVLVREKPQDLWAKAEGEELVMGGHLWLRQLVTWES